MNALLPPPLSRLWAVAWHISIRFFFHLKFKNYKNTVVRLKRSPRGRTKMEHSFIHFAFHIIFKMHRFKSPFDEKKAMPLAAGSEGPGR